MAAGDHRHRKGAVVSGALGVRTVIVRDAKARDDAFAVRIAVFVGEQQIPREEEIDEHDDTDAVHCVAYATVAERQRHGDTELEAPVGAGRLVPVRADDRPYGKIGRMAVLASHRGAGVGAVVLRALEDEGVRLGLRTFRLSAQLHAVGFYERAGYVQHGDVYDDVGIPHIDMAKTVGGLGTSDGNRS
jgi:predicted GNAT family N-acyltransferase